MGSNMILIKNNVFNGFNTAGKHLYVRVDTVLEWAFLIQKRCR